MNISLEIPANEFSVINKNFTSKDKTRYYMNGIHIVAGDGFINIQATDGAKGIIGKIVDSKINSDSFFSFIINAVDIEKIMKTLDIKSKNKNIKIQIKENSSLRTKFNLILDKMSLECDSVDGSFPKIKNIFPKSGFETGLCVVIPDSYEAFLNFNKEFKSGKNTKAPIFIGQKEHAPILVKLASPNYIGVCMPEIPRNLPNDWDSSTYDETIII